MSQPAKPGSRFAQTTELEKNNRMAIDDVRRWTASLMLHAEVQAGVRVHRLANDQSRPI
jgi:hypothetical protein